MIKQESITPEYRADISDAGKTTMTDASTTATQSKKQQKPKTIRQPGSSIERVSQACDRCRAKKTRCDGKKPCSQCAAVGFECKISDKLSRRAFPRGYTETLEERIRELEFENKKLTKLIDLKNEEFALATQTKTSGSLSSGANASLLTDENLKIFNSSNNATNNNNPGGQAAVDSGAGHTHHDGTPCFCNNYPHSVHERPVSIAGSVDLSNDDEDDHEQLLNPLRRERLHSIIINNNTNTTNTNKNNSNSNNNNPSSSSYYNNVSFEQINAPGAAAAISLQKKAQNQNFINLSTLVAMSIPRTTAETLFIPSLLARICNVHGFNSKAAITTAKSIAGLKENYQDFNKNINYSNFSFKAINFNKLTKEESLLFFQNLNLPNQVNLDLFITSFFNNWNKVIPILNKQQFLYKYLKFNKSRESNFKDGALFGEEKFVETLILVVTLVMLSQERNNSSLSNQNATQSPGPHPHHHQGQGQQLPYIKRENSPKMFKDNSNFEILQYYNHIIHEFIRSDISQVASLTTLQNLSLELLYCLSIGDLTNSYDIRGKLITMGQQLRLHRCPSAVLGNNGSAVSQLQQGERRILFWCTYILDTFSALILGVPRLLKDYEIECALPFSNEDKENNNAATGNDINDSNMVIINNNKLSLVGKVCNLALEVMRYAKILGNIVDSIFKRNENNNEDFCLMYENVLNNWKKNLPPALSFDQIDTNKVDLYSQLNEQQLLLIFLYYYAKILLYLPNLSKELVTTKSSSTYIIIQQSTAALLNITNTLASQQKSFYYLPLPFNLSREKARISLLYAKGSLEYTRGGALFQDSRNLLQSIINELKIENGIGMLGCLSDNCIDNLDSAVESILSQPVSKKNSSKKKASPLKNDIKMEDADIMFKVPSPPNVLQQQQRGSGMVRKSSVGQQAPQPQPAPAPAQQQAQKLPSQASQVKQQAQQAHAPLAHVQQMLAQHQQQQQQQQQEQQQFAQLQQFPQQKHQAPIQQQQQAVVSSAYGDQKPTSNDVGLDAFNDTLIDFTVDGSLGLNTLLDFEFDLDFGNNGNNFGAGSNNNMMGVSNTSPQNNVTPPSTSTSADPHSGESVASNSASLFSWQQ